MKKVISYLDKIPKGYGVAYRCSDKLMAVCYIIPINLIVRRFWDIYWRIIAGWFPIKYEKDLYKRERKAYNRAYKNALSSQQIDKELYLRKGYKFTFRLLKEKWSEEKVKKEWDKLLTTP